MLKAFILSTLLAYSSGDGVTKTLSVDETQSTIAWVGKKVTGQHNGEINIKTASLDLKDGKLTGGSFTIDMTSLIATDLEGEWKQKLEGHLKSEDFFGVEKFPTAQLVITKVKDQGAGKYQVTGNATIKGITKKIEFPAQIVLTENQVIGTATIVIDRSEFNVRYGSGSFFDDLGDKTIYDDFELSVRIVAAK